VQKAESTSFGIKTAPAAVDADLEITAEPARIAIEDDAVTITDSAAVGVQSVDMAPTETTALIAASNLSVGKQFTQA